MSAKLINEKCFENAEQYEHVKALAASIKQRHTLINQEQEKIDEEKSEIGKMSEEIFFDDLEQKKVPELHGNHEYHIPGNIVSVQFRVSSRPMVEINKQPADIFLKNKFGEEIYKKVFTEKASYEVGATPAKLAEQAQERPELFRIALRDDLDFKALQGLIREHPELVTIQVTDTEQYAKVYPAHVVKTVKVKNKNGFIDKCAKLDGTILTKCRSILKTLLRPSVSTAVVCGNAVKTKSKK